MNPRAPLALLVLTLTAAAPTCADTIHWSWRVEVNGHPVDATQPIPVAPADEVDIQLYAAWTPHQWGLATAYFSIAASDQFFSAATRVDIDESRGNGREYSLAQLCTEAGTFLDTDGSGIPDRIDNICAAQLPFFLNDTFDDRNPIPVYRIEWQVGTDLTLPITLTRAPVWGSGLLIDQVFEDQWGTVTDYEPDADALIFVPTPPTLAAFLIPLSLSRCARQSHAQP